MNKTTNFATEYPFTFNFAISVLEKQFNATYRGTKTVREMCSSLTDWIMWEDKSPEDVYHQFEPNGDDLRRIVADNDLIQLANHYSN